MRPTPKKISYVILLCMIISLKGTAQMDKKQEISLSAVPEIGKCFIQSDSIVIEKVKLADLINWVDHPPFKVKCEDKKEYLLKSYEFTFLTLKPFMNQSYGVGDNKMIPILARKALETLKTGDTVILKTVVLIDQNSKESTVRTISFKLTE